MTAGTQRELVSDNADHNTTFVDVIKEASLTMHVWATQLNVGY